MAHLYIRTYVLILLYIGINPEPVLSVQTIMEAFTDNTRLVVNIRFENSTRTECFVYSESGNNLPINSVHVTKLPSSEIEKLIKNCSKHHPETTIQTRKKRTAIFPGTKWCGIGNVAQNYSDLGESRKVDMCCREHDHCGDFIMPFRSKHGLFNFSVFTRSHCRCDRKFKGCLHQEILLDSSVAELIYNIYFKFFQMSCFEEKSDRVCTDWFPPCKNYKDVKRWSFSSP